MRPDEAFPEEAPEDRPSGKDHFLPDTEIEVPRAASAKDGPAARLKALRESRYTTPREAAAALGMSHDTYNSHETGSRGFNRDQAVEYATHFGVTAGYLMFGEGAPIPVTGIIGGQQADAIHTFRDGTQHNGHVLPPPYPRPDALAALQILGPGLGPAYVAGDVVYLDRTKLEAPIERRAVNGRESVVVTASGTQLLSRVAVRPDGHVVLLRYAGSPDLSSRIVAATPVLWIRRAQADD